MTTELTNDKLYWIDDNFVPLRFYYNPKDNQVCQNKSDFSFSPEAMKRFFEIMPYSKNISETLREFILDMFWDDETTWYKIIKGSSGFRLPIHDSKIHGDYVELSLFNKYDDIETIRGFLKIIKERYLPVRDMYRWYKRKYRIIRAMKLQNRLLSNDYIVDGSDVITNRFKKHHREYTLLKHLHRFYSQQLTILTNREQILTFKLLLKDYLEKGEKFTNPITKKFDSSASATLLDLFLEKYTKSITKENVWLVGVFLNDLRKYWGDEFDDEKLIKDIPNANLMLEVYTKFMENRRI